MTTFSEQGHGKNVANLEDVISYCTGYGAPYNPTLNAIKIANLNTLKTSAATAVANAGTTFATFKNATNARELVFLPVKGIITRAVNAIKACGATSLAVDDATTILNKVRGKRAKPLKKPATTTTSSLDSDPIEVHISVSQQSFDSMIEHLAKLIDLLITIPAYNPNEADLKITALNALLTSMKASNTAVITATTNASNARISRNDILYKSVAGLVDVANEVKAYVKSVFGATSPQYKQISKIQFKKLIK